MNFQVVVDREPQDYLRKLDNSVRLRILKKLVQLKRDDLNLRHLRHGLKHHVGEVGGYRIALLQDENAKTRTIVFIGNHEEYEKWLWEQ